MATSEDKVIKEKKRGVKASWEQPEMAGGEAAEAKAEDAVPTNYENTNSSYVDPAGFEVRRTPGRLG
jgi:hypothetical protein